MARGVGVAARVEDAPTLTTRNCEIDHLVVSASTLEAGVEWVQSRLGVTVQAGGQHDRMGTHNALLRLGDSIYLEVIASNPAAPRPGRPRWFELDRISPSVSPGLATWLGRTKDIKATSAACGGQFGAIEPMSRGDLNWLITIPPDGGLNEGGVVPMLIEWGVEKHPAAGLEDKGCALMLLELFHPDVDTVEKILDCLGLRTRVEVHDLPPGEQPYLVALIETPQGLRAIGSPPGRSVD